MAKFFIDRPVFAWVIAIIMMMGGLLAIRTLPISQYPMVAPPTIGIQARYPGASAQTVQDTCTQIIEQKMNGIDNLRYMESTSNADGSMQLTLTFNQGTNPDIAQMQVQNKLQLAMPVLPKEVQQEGVTVQKTSGNFLIIVGFVSEDGSMKAQDISDFIAASVQEPISRVPGVGDTQFFGSQYAMRIWINPDALNNYGLAISDITTAVTAQNAQISGGELGGLPAVPGQRLAATIVTQTRLNTTDEFADILLKVNADGSQVRLGDVARLELGGESYTVTPRLNGKPASGLGVKLASGANALETARLVHLKIDELSRFFPEGLKVVYPWDTSPFVRLSIEEVVKTLIEAVVLVFIVMFLFLQNIRATLIPTLAVPVVLLGTFAVMAACGFTINTLTMFGMVLAIGLLVDDAIIVVENVERVMSEEGLSPKEATRKSMGQITGALIGIALVLSAVFVPMAFFSGSTGVIYRQFSITIASAMLLSVVVAIVFTPALCATMLKPIDPAHHAAKRGFFGWFNRCFEKLTAGYSTTTAACIRRWGRTMIIFLVLTGGMAWFFHRIPTAFLPEEDQGMALLVVTLPPGSTQEETLSVLERIEDIVLNTEKEAVQEMFTAAGFSFGGRGQNTALGFIKFRDWSERKDKSLKVHAVAGRIMGKLQVIKGAMAFAVTPPAIMELGNASGFDIRLQDLAGLGHETLLAARGQVVYSANVEHKDSLVAVRPSGLDDTPQFKIDIDTELASAHGLNVADINQAFAAAWGGTYVNDFIDRGRVKKVYLQGDAPYRMSPEDIDRWYVRNNTGQMVPFSAFCTMKWIYGSPALERFNGFPSMKIEGQPAPGTSSGTAMATMEAIADKLPRGIDRSWAGLSYEERLSGSQAPALYAISLLVVFLCLAALYESWTVPFAVMLIVPMGVLGAVLAVMIRGLPNDVYFQVGLLTTVGLSAKNAILIVEFAKEGYDKGMGLVEATVHAARLRLRPILMTSLAFGFGVLPLAIANGAGSGSQNAIGTSVLGGVVGGTLLAIILVPVFFVFITRLFRSGPAKKD
ncbi:efflux RND transporter permease subunit [Geminisphaera colitermitum]|uniref:efflux RND transporter permease subunit n=1 Tax=Geminisphaera colitermitum TaxID=1148786 RepID=UPI000158CE7D|nr:efflux RND transporter permease subunit [Geminisphaera colitermitum]